MVIGEAHGLPVPQHVRRDAPTMLFRPKLADVDQGLERVRGTFKRTVHHDSIEFGGIAVGIQGKRALTQRTPFSATTLALTKNVVNNFVDILPMLDDPSLPLVGYLPGRCYSADVWHKSSDETGHVLQSQFDAPRLDGGGSRHGERNKSTIRATARRDRSERNSLSKDQRAQTSRPPRLLPLRTGLTQVVECWRLGFQLRGATEIHCPI